MNNKRKLLAAAAVVLIIAPALPAAGEPGSDYQLTMTWVSGPNRFATIDGGFYSPGDRLPDGARVVEIESGRVTVVRDGRTAAVAIAAQPPAAQPSAAGPARRADDRAYGYLDEAIEELERAMNPGPGLAPDPDRRQALAALRDRLLAARERLAGEALAPAVRQRIERELDADWQAARRRLDSIRSGVVAEDPGTPGVARLRAMQGVLEEAALAAVAPMLARIELPEAAGRDGGAPAASLDTIRELLGAYPDYHALADRLEALGAAGESSNTASARSEQAFNSGLADDASATQNGE